ncbi:hypothetical protein JM16_006444 [Phytophthora kernoviae]|uniref:F-box/LRR-repeat protein 15-like leucin rich repeat domain-containing protein n=1 Tax=Phytophthora kernoviae TaxID=325452 RepID=A0A8T0LT76_9STRA|nr:hypothetical protein JM16_006444 [Phytophthora kernoviae]
MKSLAAPPTELFCQDVRGTVMKREVDLGGFISVSNEWLIAIASHPVVNGTKEAEKCRTLVLESASITDSGIAHVVKLKYLTRLDVSRCHALTDDGLTSIRRHLGLLQELRLDDCHHFSSSVLCKVWKDCTRLHSLSVRGCPDVRQCKNLTSSGILYLASSSIKDMSVQYLAVDDCLSVDNMAFFGFETSTGLRSLASLSLCGLGIDETAISWIVKGCGGSLQHLNVARCKTLSDFALLLMAPLISSPVFVKLSMEDCPLITDTGVSVLAAACPQLESINLSKCPQITDFATEALASCCFQLRVLVLANTRGITDITLTALAFTKISLEVLDLSGNTRVTDEGILALCTGCQQIQELRLKGCDRLSQKTVKRCNDSLLPFTKPFMTASFIKTIATGGGTTATILEPLPKPHIELLRLLLQRYEGAVVLQAKFHKWRKKRFTIDFLARRRLLRESRAAKKIQACIREFLAWRRFLHLLSLKESVDKIVFVQAHVRGNKVRRQMNAAALTIQSVFRGHMARKRVAFYRALATATAIAIQTEWRRYAARKTYLYQRGKIIHTQRMLIQRIYRGHLARKRYAQIFKEKIKAASLLQHAYRTRQARRLFEISKAATALKAKEQYDRSLLGRLEARRNPIDELYRRAKLPREKEILTKLKEKWEAHRVLEERAVRKLKRECTAVWANADEIIGNQYGMRRKLYGVTENVYSTHRELEQRKELRSSLEKELAGLKNQVLAFKQAMREAVTSRRMLEGNEVFDLLKEQGLYLEPDPPSNQRD